MNIKRKVDKKPPILIDKKLNQNMNEPVIKKGLKEVVGQVLQFVTVAGDFV